MMKQFLVLAKGTRTGYKTRCVTAVIGEKECIDALGILIKTRGFAVDSEDQPIPTYELYSWSFTLVELHISGAAGVDAFIEL